MNNDSLWYKLNDIFYDYHCHDGFMDNKYPNNYSFEKGKYRYIMIEKENYVLTKIHISNDFVEYTALFKTLNELKSKLKEELK